MKIVGIKKDNNNRRVYSNIHGNSMPIVMLVMLIVMIIGSAVAYSTVQMFSIVRNEEHNQMTYIAAESAIERSISNLDRYLTKEEFATDRDITYSSDSQFINDIVGKLNGGDSQIKNSFNIPVYADSSINSAEIVMSFSWDGSTYTRTGNKLKFPLQIIATAKMENGMFKSIGRKVVAVKEYEVWIYNPFVLNGAVYSLGDFVAKGSGTSTITNDVYVFGTGLDKPNRMDQYYMGGICAVNSAKLHIQNGSVYTRNLLRVGNFNTPDENECAIIVDHDVVAQGIQAFGINDAIVIIRDAYTFDDIEMNGANSCIAVNGNYFGLNPGDGVFHDTSSAVINTSPRYAGATINEFTQSRIVINGYTFVNGSAFRMDGGIIGHKLEDVALAWEGNQPVYIDENCDNTEEYLNALRSNSRGERNGFSVLLGNAGWNNITNLISNWELWDDWISEIRSRADGRTNNFTGLSVPARIKGFCHYAVAANNTLYPSDEAHIEIPTSVVCNIANDVNGLNVRPLDGYIHETWFYSTHASIGIPKGLENMMSFLEGHVHVFSRKEYPEEASGEISYKYNSGMIPGSFGSTTEFLRIRDQLEEIDEDVWDCVFQFHSDDNDVNLTPVNLVDFLEDEGVDITDYFLIINLDPDRELIIDRDVINGIIFTMGKIKISNGATVNGSIIAAGMGYDPYSYVKGSAADFDDDGNPRLPRVVRNTNIRNFENWDYAALILDSGGGNIHFPGRENLFNQFDETIDGANLKDILEDIF